MATTTNTNDDHQVPCTDTEKAHAAHLIRRQDEEQQADRNGAHRATGPEKSQILDWRSRPHPASASGHAVVEHEAEPTVTVIGSPAEVCHNWMSA